MISVDTPEDNKKFAEMHGADYPILSDVSKEIAKAYDVLGTIRPRKGDGRSISRRTARSSTSMPR